MNHLCGNSLRGSFRRARWMLLLASTLPLTLAAQSPNSVQIPYASTGIGIPADQTQTACSAGSSFATTLGATGDNCAPTQALLKSPQAVVIDSATGNIFIADNGDKALREVYKSGINERQRIVNAYNKLSLITTSSLIVGNIYNACGPFSGGFTSITAAGGLCGNTTLTPYGATIDSTGNVIETEGNSRIRMVYNTGTVAQNLLKVTTGGIGTVNPVQGYEYPIIYASLNGYYGDGGTAIAALTNTARGVYVDANENIYIADSKSNAIRMINGSSGIITTIAGSSCTQAVVTSYVTISGATAKVPAAVSSAGGCTAGSTGDGGPATSATLSNPLDVVMDANGNLYIADSGNTRVRVIYMGSGSIPGVTGPQFGYIYTVAGGGKSITGGAATTLKFSSTTGLGFDASGNLYIADGSGAKIWQVDAATQVAVQIAGGGTAGALGTLCSSSFTSGPTRTYANGDGCLGTLAILNFPTGRISFDAQGNLYVADSTANVVRVLSHKVLPAPSTAVGSKSGLALGFAPLAAQTVGGTSFGAMGGSTVDFSDFGGSTCNTNGTALTAGKTCYVNVAFTPTLPGLREGGVQVFSSTGAVLGSNFISGLAIGPEEALDSATQTAVGSGTAPTGVAFGGGSIYVSDKTSGSVLQYSSASATSSTKVITGLSSPGQVWVDGEGNVLVADTGNGRIAIYSPVTTKTTYLTGYTAPQGVAADAAGNVFVADTGANRVVELTQNGSTTVVSTTVTAPTQLSFDASGNLYVIDSGNGRAVTIAGGTGAQTAVALGLYNPASVAIDAAGDFYVLDKSTNALGFISANGALTTTLSTGLITPTALASDSLGNLAVADTTGGVTYFNRQNIPVAFYPLNVGQTSAFSSFVLTNIGNAALQFTSSGLYVGSGNTTDFAVSPSTSSGCTSAGLASGIGCSFSATFSPVALGNFSEKLLFPSNAGNTSSAGATLTGNGVNLANSNLNITSTPSSTSTISYGSPVTVNFKLSQSGTTAATGVILVQVNGVKLTTLNVISGAASYTFSPQAGTFTFTGQYSGDANYASSYASLTFTVSPAATSTTIAYSGKLLNTTSSGTPTFTLSSSVTSAATGLTGNVSFYAGTKLLGMSSLNAMGVATLTITGASAINALSNPAFSATYLGNTNFATSTSTTVTIKGDFGMTPLATSLAVLQGDNVSTTISVTPYLGLTGTVSFSCSNLPANSLCRFLTCPQIPAAGASCPVPSNTVLTFDGNSTADVPGQVTVEVYTNVPSNLAQARPQALPRMRMIEEATLVFGSFGLLVIRRRKRSWVDRLSVSLLALVGAAVLCLGVSGCGGDNFYKDPGLITPAGTTIFTVTGTSSNGSTESIQINLTVASK